MRGLILGCSISAGTHKLDHSNPLGEVVDNQIGWYNFLGIPNLVVYSFPGGGYLNYATLLDKIDISKFDYILLQESFEPRFLLTNNDDFNFTKANDIDHYTLKDSCKTISIRSAKETMELTVPRTDNQLSFARFAVAYISSINKPCAMFHCRRDTNQFNYGNIKVLDIKPSIDEVIYKNPNYHNEMYMELGPWQQGGQIIGHPTLEGNKAIGELVSKPLQEWLKTI